MTRAASNRWDFFTTGALCLNHVATMPGWFVMWTMEGRLVHATTGPFDTKKAAKSYARELSNIVRKGTGDSTEGTYFLLKGGPE